MIEGLSSDGRVLIVGAGGHGASVLETVTAAGYVVGAFVDAELGHTAFHGLPVLRDIPRGVAHEYLYALAAGDNSRRRQLFDSLSPEVRTAQFPSFIHPSASVAANAIVGPGTVVMQGAILGSAASVGSFCILNSGSVLEHECVMEDFASLAPRSVVAGRVHIGQGATIALGASVMQGIRVGVASVLGANSYLNRDLPNGRMAYGTPAREIRSV